MATTTRKKVRNRICDESAKELAAAVIRQAATDLRFGSGVQRKNAEFEIRRGGLDIYLGLCGIDMTGEEFIKKVKASNGRLKGG